ncbi:MAG: hypothetical protein LQ341_005314 [Variospora aurantia]|nr:MAG: hypothetical protein LQ341_005314 [Variospora aurantia]
MPDDDIEPVPAPSCSGLSHAFNDNRTTIDVNCDPGVYDTKIDRENDTKPTSSALPPVRSM